MVVPYNNYYYNNNNNNIVFIFFSMQNKSQKINLFRIILGLGTLNLYYVATSVFFTVSMLRFFMFCDSIRFSVYLCLSIQYCSFCSFPFFFSHHYTLTDVFLGLLVCEMILLVVFISFAYMISLPPHPSTNQHIWK